MNTSPSSTATLLSIIASTPLTNGQSLQFFSFFSEYLS